MAREQDEGEPGVELRPELRPPGLPNLVYPELIGVIMQVSIVALFLLAMGARC